MTPTGSTDPVGVRSSKPPARLRLAAQDERARADRRAAADAHQVLLAAHDGERQLRARALLAAVVVAARDEITAAVFSPDGRYILTTSASSVRVWAARGADILELAQQRACREFTLEERKQYADLLGRGK